MTIKLNSKFGPSDACWYRLSTRDRVPSIDDIPRYNRKHMQVYFSKMANIQAWVASGPDAVFTNNLTYFNSSAEVSTTLRNFTQANYDNLYIIVKPVKGKTRGSMSADIVFRYYEYDPMCATFTYWNGYRCKPDYGEYCASLTEDKKRQFITKTKSQGIEVNMTNINFTVTYNKVSKACQINVITIERNTVIEEIKEETIPLGPIEVEETFKDVI